MAVIDRPLRLGELFAETIRIYGERFWAALGLGLIYAAGLALASAVHPAPQTIIIAVFFAATYAAAARLVSGDGFAEAWAQVGGRVPLLAGLAFIVAVPFAAAGRYLLLLIVAVAWLALTGFAIPAAMLERAPEGEGWFGRIARTLGRSLVLARVEYLHAAGVAAALVIVYLLVSVLLGGALYGFADQGTFIAGVLVQVVLSPFIFFGLSVLYFDQKARGTKAP